MGEPKQAGDQPVNMKCVVVGDGAVGKTCLLTSYCDNEFPEEYVPTIFDNTTKDMQFDGRDVTLGLWDTAGQEDYDRLRPLSYPGADVFVLCFSVDHRVTLDNIKAKWQPELYYHCPTVPVVMVGTKVDLRGKGDSKKFVSRSEGEKVAKSIRAIKYIECSAKTSAGVASVFDEVVRAHLYGRVKGKRKVACTLL